MTKASSNDFEKETGIQVVYDVFETNEEMYPVIEAGGVSYDVVCPSDYMIQKMIENNLLAEINFDNIPNYKEIGQEYLDISKGFEPGKQIFRSLLLGYHGNPLQYADDRGAGRSCSHQMGRSVG